jgi:hypothetical protein
LLLKENPNSPHHLEGGDTPPEAVVTGFELIALQAGTKTLFDLLGKGTQSGIYGVAEYMKKEWLLANIVLASWFNDGLYQFAIKAVNVNFDAIYIYRKSLGRKTSPEHFFRCTPLRKWRRSRGDFTGRQLFSHSCTAARLESVHNKID